jgi:hypothetical protein
MRRLLSVSALAFSVLLATASPASALKPFRFQPGPNPDILLEGVCDFPVLGQDVVNKLVITDFFDRDGNLVRETGTGQIVERVTNLETGKSLVKNISGPGTFTFDETGATLVATGIWLFGFFPGQIAGSDEGIFWFTSGRFVWRFSFLDETWTLLSHTGTIQEGCALLA